MRKLSVAPRLAALLCLLPGAWLAGSPSARAAPPTEVGPEDVPADNRFDTARMISSLVVPQTKVTRFRYPVVDAHSHDVYAQTPQQVADWVQLQKQVGVAQSFIFTGKSGEQFRAAVARYASAYPGRFLMFAGISPAGIGSAEYGNLLRERLRADVQAGALGLGELTDKGMGLVRVGDRAYYIDDPVFDPLWDEAGRLRLPVFVHIAEPAAFYQPADERNDLRRSQNWSLYNKGTPGFEDLQARFARVLARHPHTSFVAVHAFNLSNDLGASLRYSISIRTSRWILRPACGNWRASPSALGVSSSSTPIESCSAPTTIRLSPCTWHTCASSRPRTNGSGPRTRNGGAVTACTCPTACCIRSTATTRYGSCGSTSISSDCVKCTGSLASGPCTSPSTRSCT